MNKTIVSLAILKVNWDRQRTDYVETFVPFVVELLKTKNYIVVNDIDQICNDFRDLWGIEIPYHPMQTILNRLRKQGFIKRRSHEFVIVDEKIQSSDMSAVAHEQRLKTDSVVQAFRQFADVKFDKAITSTDGEKALISFLKTYDLDILFLARRDTALPDVKPSKQMSYLFSRFVTSAHSNQPEMFDTIIDITTGYTLANVLMIDVIPRFTRRLRGLEVFLDTSLLFRLMGIESVDRKLVYRTFLTLLKNYGVKLKVFEHTLDETKGILEGCLRWSESADFDYSKANPALRFFHDRGYTESDIERFIVNIDSVLHENSIVVDSTDYSEPYHKFQIDENMLRETIIDVYRKRVPLFDEAEKELTLDRDVRSIAAVYRMRQGKDAQSLGKAKAVFITTNSTLAYACQIFDGNEREGEFRIPTCLTDTFVGTTIWLQQPLKWVALDEKRILADCYAAT